MAKILDPSPANTVDEYLLALAPDMRLVMEKLRLAIRSAAPKAEELISYQIPTYKYHGALVHFAAFKTHGSFITVSKNILSIFSNELRGYKTSGTTIRFTTEKPLPVGLVKKIIKSRIKENEERASANKGKKKT